MGRKKEAIVATAKELVGEIPGDGCPEEQLIEFEKRIAEIPVRKICKNTPCSPATFYKYFSDLDELLKTFVPTISNESEKTTSSKSVSLRLSEAKEELKELEQIHQYTVSENAAVMLAYRKVVKTNEKLKKQIEKEKKRRAKDTTGRKAGNVIEIEF